MNFSFLIDNSLTSCQLTSTGIEILDIAKNAVEYFVKKRMKMLETKYDTFHLLTTGKDKYDMVQSSWVHDPGHFFNTLKVIQPEFDCDLQQALRLSFSNLNKFRILNGSDNMYGGRDCLKLDPGIVILFTNCDDEDQLSQIEAQFILKRQLPNRWDQKLVVFMIQPAGFESYEQGTCDFQQRNSFLSRTSSFKIWQQLTHEVGRGNVFQILTQEALLGYLDELMAECQPQICIRLTSLPDQISKSYRYEIVEKSIERNDVLLAKGQEYLESVNQTLNNVVVRSFFKINYHWVSHRLKSAINMTIYTKVYLPDQYLLQIKDQDNYDWYPGIPNYSIDFTSIIKCRLPANLPYQDVHIDDRLILDYVQIISQNINKNHIRFPLFYSQNHNLSCLKFLIIIDDSQQMEEEGKQAQLFVGVLQYDKPTQTLTLQFYFPNFIILSYIMNQIKTNNYNPKQVEKDLTIYFRSVPNYYSPCIKRVFIENRIDAAFTNRNWQYLIDDALFTNYMNNLKNLQNKVLFNRKIAEEMFQKLKMQHVLKKSNCCGVLSENYENTMAQQLDTPFRRAQLISQNRYKDKKLIQCLFSYQQCKSNLPPIPIQPQNITRDHNIGEDEFEFGYEPAFCGNPWKLYKKIYRDGMEVRQNQELYDVSNEDLILTKMDPLKSVDVYSKGKNKRKGYITYSDIRLGSGKRKSSELSVLHIEDGFKMDSTIDIEQIENTKIEIKGLDNGKLTPPQSPQIQRKIYTNPYEFDKEIGFIDKVYTTTYQSKHKKNNTCLQNYEIFDKLLKDINSGCTQDKVEDFIHSLDLDDKSQLQIIQKRAAEIIKSQYNI